MIMISLSLFLALAQAAPPQTTQNPTVLSVRGAYDLVKDYIVKAADQVPEEHYGFKPTPEVRSMGELFAHIADANFMICGVASGEKAPMEQIEKTKKTKADVQEALVASFTFCDGAFEGMTDARMNEPVKVPLPGTHTRLGVLAFNSAHDFEHYGNIVTYMRLKGLVPPSTAARSAR